MEVHISVLIYSSRTKRSGLGAGSAKRSHQVASGFADGLLLRCDALVRDYGPGAERRVAADQI